MRTWHGADEYNPWEKFFEQERVHVWLDTVILDGKFGILAQDVDRGLRKCAHYGMRIFEVLASRFVLFSDVQGPRKWFSLGGIFTSVSLTGSVSAMCFATTFASVCSAVSVMCFLRLRRGLVAARLGIDAISRLALGHTINSLIPPGCLVRSLLHGLLNLLLLLREYDGLHLF